MPPSPFHLAASLCSGMAIRCTIPNCNCECFSPGKTQLRTCETCKHGWVAHGVSALDKLGFRHLYNCNQVEIVQPNIVFDIASLMLYGTQATPVRLKILLDRLFSVLQHDEVLQVLHGFGWSYEDYARGYILQDHTGKVLDKWTVASREEEQIILQQFLRFGETKSITQQILLQESNEKPDYIVQTPRTESDIRKFIERSNRVANPFLRHKAILDSQSILNNRQPYPPNNRMLQLPSFPTSTQSMSPNGSVHNFGSPGHTSSPISMSPLNRLQNMQPYDFRRDGHSPVSPQSSPIISGQQTLLNSSSAMPLALTTTPMTSEAGLGSLASSNSDVPRPDSADFMEDRSSESGAINLSRPSQSMYATKKVKHLRKSANPMKRRWSPISLGTLTTSPCTGKKRVQCNVCLKTFCDKGALKIHFSAVHLKEMHKCTVEGCNMMFSSRRSRNRHSANPNPKLHTPHFRRKSYGDTRNTTSISSLQPTMVSGGTILHTEKPHNLGELVNNNSNNNNSLINNNNNNIDSSNSEGIQEDQPFYVNANNEVGLLPHLNHKQEIEDSDNSDAESLTPSIKEDQNLNKGVRKRKNMNPTRLAVTDEEIYVSSDDASTDNFSHDDNIMDTNVEGSDNKSDENLQLKSNDLKSEKKSTQDEPLALLPAYKIKQEKFDHIPEDLVLGGNSFRQIKENAMRHMESFSHARLGDMMSTSLLSNSRVMVENQLPIQNGPTSYSSLSQSSDVYENSNHNNKNRDTPPPNLPLDSSSNGCLMNNSEHDHESNMSHSSTESHSPSSIFRDVNSVSCFDIPVDKENPRKCTACGKFFQNHFGVKTHYQNVHLKLMHKCTVEGCNAAFPSKRSRDRHSANLNLHRKLLSTTSDKFDLDRNSIGQSLRDEFLARIYESHNMAVSEYHNQQMQTAHDLSNNERHRSESPINNHEQMNSVQSLSFQNIGSSEFGVNADSETAPPSPSNHSYSSYTRDCNYDSANEESQSSDQEGSVHCHICKLKFRDNLALKEHFEKMHPKETFSCTIGGCDKIFSTRKSRNRHSQNDNLHKHLVNNGS
uniref:Disconnected n=1 Tax=Euperipatoides kanangrensis TaxID=488523 RepID=A0A330J070_9BILA|nr:disconnected [Euperipatoides kanangrensis]